MRRDGLRALEAALDLAAMPALAAAMRLQPLPGDVLPLIRVAAGCQATCQELAEASGREPQQIAEAAPFYLEQVLFRADGDPYRTLGAAPGASREALRERLGWLMRWLHPDRNGGEWESVFAARVLAAWETLQREGRAAGERDDGPPQRRGRRGWQLRLRWIADPAAGLPVSRPQLAMLVVAWAIVLALLLVPAFRNFWSPFAAAQIEPPASAGEEDR
jgi:hypothetical protein